MFSGKKDNHRFLWGLLAAAVVLGSVLFILSNADPVPANSHSASPFDSQPREAFKEGNSKNQKQELKNEISKEEKILKTGNDRKGRPLTEDKKKKIEAHIKQLRAQLK